MKKLKMGMVGAGSGAFIGAVHRRAAIMDGEVEFVAGALSSNREKALASGRALGLPEDRNLRHLDSQAALADAPWTGERQQPHCSGTPAEQQADYLLHLAFAA